jgi:hypothetical protein
MYQELLWLTWGLNNFYLTVAVEISGTSYREKFEIRIIILLVLFSLPARALPGHYICG